MNFDAFDKVTGEGHSTIAHIIKRAKAEGGVSDPLSLHMDLAAVHGTVGLRLAALLAAPAGDFWHDLSGIGQHLNRQTGVLEDCFLPRYSK